MSYQLFHSTGSEWQQLLYQKHVLYAYEVLLIFHGYLLISDQPHLTHIK